MASFNVVRRHLGKNGPLVPAIGFGTMGMTHSYGPSLTEEEVFAILDRAYEVGNRFWDTADVYGASEEIIGRWFKKTGKRSDIFLATKFGFGVNSTGMSRNVSPEYCKQACAKSLEALGVEFIDLCADHFSEDYMHIADTETPIEETMKALVDLQAQGKIKHIGLSMVSAKCLRRAVGIAPVAAMQVEYSLFTRNIEKTSGKEANILSTCRELGVAVVIATPLGRGILTSSYGAGQLSDREGDSRIAMLPRFQEENAKHNALLVDKLRQTAERKDCTITQLALAWLLKQGDDIFPIPGTRRVKYMEENFAASNLTLSDEEEAELRGYAESVQIAGETVPDAFMSWIYEDTKELGM